MLEAHKSAVAASLCGCIYNYVPVFADMGSTSHLLRGRVLHRHRDPRGVRRCVMNAIHVSAPITSSRRWYFDAVSLLARHSAPLRSSSTSAGPAQVLNLHLM